MKTTNYFNAFIEVADDCPAAEGEVPTAKRDKVTVASYQFDMIIAHPYKYTSDDIIFNQYADKEGIAGQARKEAREEYFQTGRACLRASPLGKRYGWGFTTTNRAGLLFTPKAPRNMSVSAKTLSSSTPKPCDPKSVTILTPAFYGISFRRDCNCSLVLAARIALLLTAICNTSSINSNTPASACFMAGWAACCAAD